MIIVNYNGIKYLPKLFGSIFSYSPKTVEQKIIIVDNNSTDGSADYIAKNHNEVHLIRLNENVGFAEGNNVAFRYILRNGFNYAMLLNQDTIVEPGYLDNLIVKINSDEKIAAVQPKIMLWPETNLINSVGNVIHFLGFGYTLGHKKPITIFKPPADEVNYCAGAGCLIKTSALIKTGLFDSEYFMYHEDLDLGWRFKLLGYKNVIASDAVIYHQYEFSRSIKKYYFMERNRYLTILKNYKILTLLMLLPALMIMEIGLFVYAVKNGWWLEKLKVYSYFLHLKNWKKILIARRQVQKIRTLSDSEVVKKFSGLILHQEISNKVVEKIANPLFNLYWKAIKLLIVW